MSSLKDEIFNSKFNLNGKIAVITGGGGFLGKKHAEICTALGAKVVLLDVNKESLDNTIQSIAERGGLELEGIVCDISQKDHLEQAVEKTLARFGDVDILINNAANNPKVAEEIVGSKWSRLENFSVEDWNQDVSIGLTGAFLATQAFGNVMAEKKSGVILNIASDLSVSAPDQRIYLKGNIPENEQFTKPVTYSVVKSGLVGLTLYTATYWAEKGIRVNALSPGGVFNNQDPEFVKKVSQLIPLGRMARIEEIQSAVAFLVSDASSYMTGQNIVLDGGRSCW